MIFQCTIRTAVGRHSAEFPAVLSLPSLLSLTSMYALNLNVVCLLCIEVSRHSACQSDAPNILFPVAWTETGELYWCYRLLSSLHTCLAACLEASAVTRKSCCLMGCHAALVLWAPPTWQLKIWLACLTWTTLRASMDRAFCSPELPSKLQPRDGDCQSQALYCQKGLWPRSCDCHSCLWGKDVIHLKLLRCSSSVT